MANATHARYDDLLADANALPGGPLNQEQEAAFSTALGQDILLLWGPAGTGKTKVLAAIVRALVAAARFDGVALRLVLAASTYNAIDKLLGDVADALEAPGQRSVGPLLQETLLYRLRSIGAQPSQDTRVEDTLRESPNGRRLFAVLESAAFTDGKDRLRQTVARMAQATDADREIKELVETGALSADEAEALSGWLRTMAQAQVTLEEIGTALERSGRHVIVGATMGQLYELVALRGKPWDGARWFHGVVIDEASQVQVTDAVTYFCTLREQWKVVVAGDYRQLGPPRQMPQEDTRQGLLDNVFNYFQDKHHVTPVQLVRNYRTNDEIAGWPRNRFYEGKYIAHTPDRRLLFASRIPETMEAPVDWPNALPWSENWAMLLDPASPIVVITYEAKQYTVSNPFEAQVIAALAALLRRHLPPNAGDGEPEVLRRFWADQLAVVTPHRAQMSLITNTLVASKAFPRRPRPMVDTVDAVQAQERDVVLASYSVSDPDFIASEEEFILDPRRFNVTLTRARSKFVILASDALVEHLPYEKDVAEQAAAFQLFVERYCRLVATVELPYFDGGALKRMPTRVRAVGTGMMAVRAAPG